jgi:anaerobic ribonucleoside-triphosphate reductase activating protein
MQAFDSGEAQPIKTLIKLVNDSDVEGITILGGEPLDQAPALFTFLNMIRDCGKSVILFSGYTMDEIRKSPEKIKCISCVDVLIDGPYIRAQLSNKRQFVGSENQKIWFLTERYGLADFSGDNLCEVKLSTSHFELNGFPVEFLEKWDEV